MDPSVNFVTQTMSELRAASAAKSHQHVAVGVQLLKELAPALFTLYAAGWRSGFVVNGVRAS